MFALALVLSLLIGLSLGLLGGGGSILTTPILIYALGVEIKAAIATSLLVVGITSLAGMVQHARAGMVGAFAGGVVIAWIPAGVLMVLFGAMMLATSLAMFRGRAEAVAVPPQPLWKVLSQGFAVGAVAGLVGAGGGFLIVPALSLLGGLPIKKAVGTSLLVISLNSFAGFVGHIAHVSIDLKLAALVSTAAVLGSFGGSRLADKVRPETLRRGFAVFVLVMAVFVLYQQR